MGLFREFGRQVEQVKQSVTGGEGAEAGDGAEATDDAEAGDEAAYECESCGARFDTHDGECPECWSETISQTAAQ